MVIWRVNTPTSYVVYTIADDAAGPLLFVVLTRPRTRKGAPYKELRPANNIFNDYDRGPLREKKTGESLFL